MCYTFLMKDTCIICNNKTMIEVVKIEIFKKMRLIYGYLDYCPICNENKTMPNKEK